MKKAIQLLLPVLVFTGCSLDTPHLGELCPPEGKNAIVYVFENGVPVQRAEAQCPDELPVCTPFTDTSQLFGNYYCHVKCEGATVPCNGVCLGVSEVCGSTEPLHDSGEECSSNEQCKSGICVDWTCMVAPYGTTSGDCSADYGCVCPSECPLGCDDSGRCISCPDECTNGCNLLSLECCPENCREGCDSAGKCLCPGNCQFGCDSDGVCIMNPNCANGWIRDGSCACPQECIYGCDDLGSCYEPTPCDETCKGSRYCNPDNLCVFVDANHNHMHDKYETAPKQGEYCLSSYDCADGPGSAEDDKDDPNVFCDSFIGYRCSTKCTSDDECVDDGNYHYICREDGRCAPDTFTTVWKIPFSDRMLTLPKGDNTCDFEIDWGDGSTETISCEHTESISHIYIAGGEYVVKIRGDYNGFAFADGNPFTERGSAANKALRNSAPKLIEIRSFGPVKLATYAFFYCTHLVKISSVDIPDLSDSDNLDLFFYNATNFNDDIENWDVSNIEYMFKTFSGAISFNQPLAWWDTFSVLGFESTFEFALSFNQSLNMWDTSNAEYMNGMFYEAKRFNQPLNSWDVSNVSDMAYMFEAASNFNQPLEQWDVSAVEDMSYMFCNAHNFDQPLNQWKTSALVNTASMFDLAENFDQPLNQWDTSGVENMSYMFFGTIAFSQDLSSWDLSSATDLSYMFAKTESFNESLEQWDVSNVDKMDGMFRDSKAFDQPLAKWHVSETASVSYMFDGSVYSDENACGIKLSETWECPKKNLGFKGLECESTAPQQPEEPQPEAPDPEQ